MAATSDTKLRSTAGRFSPVVEALPKGRVVRCTGAEATDKKGAVWCEVEVDGVGTGWLPRASLEAAAPATAAAAAPPQPEPQLEEESDDEGLDGFFTNTECVVVGLAGSVGSGV
jgi:hypothetical protein